MLNDDLINHITLFLLPKSKLNIYFSNKQLYLKNKQQINQYYQRYKLYKEIMGRERICFSSININEDNRIHYNNKINSNKPAVFKKISINDKFTKLLCKQPCGKYSIFCNFCCYIVNKY